MFCTYYIQFEFLNFLDLETKFYIFCLISNGFWQASPLQNEILRKALSQLVKNSVVEVGGGGCWSVRAVCY